MRLTTFYLITLIFSFLFFTNCTKDTIVSLEEPTINIEQSEVKANSIVVDNFKSYLQKEIQQQHIPALSTLIFKEGEILYEGYFGYAHIQRNISLEKDHSFLLASVSKVVTATALLQLYEQGFFELDDAINDYLSFEVKVPNHQDQITFRMLLTHTSGIADGSALDDQYYYGQDSPVELADFLKNYLTSNGLYYDESDNFHAFKPGTEYEYSNIGTALIGLLVEEIAEKDFSEYCQQNIFTPLGMSHTSWHLAGLDNFIVQPYDYLDGQYEAIEHYAFTDYPNGGLRSTATDMFQFLSAFVQDGQSNNYQLLKQNTIEVMHTLQIPGIDKTVGLHLFQIDEYDNIWGHDGGEQGVATIMGFNPETQIGVIILANQGEADLEDLLIEAYSLGLEL